MCVGFYLVFVFQTGFPPSPPVFLLLRRPSSSCLSSFSFVFLLLPAFLLLFPDFLIFSVNRLWAVGFAVVGGEGVWVGSGVRLFN